MKVVHLAVVVATILSSLPLVFYLLIMDDTEHNIPIKRHMIEYFQMRDTAVEHIRIPLELKLKVEDLSCQCVDTIQICDTVHLAFVVTGYDDSRSVAKVLKSIIFYRHSPLHFHFISDTSAQMILGNLLNTWKLPSVNYSFYSIKEISVISKTNLQLDVIKLFVPSILPQSVDGVIVLHNDVKVIRDIQELWAFRYVLKKENNFFGAVENLTGLGFNSDVVMFDLHSKQQIRVWESTLKYFLKENYYTDVDIINTLIKHLPNGVYKLPCSWNVQFDIQSNKTCGVIPDDYGIISPETFLHTNKNSSVYRLVSKLIRYDADLARYGVLKCNETITARTHNFSLNSGAGDYCKQLSGISQFSFRTHLYFYGVWYHSLNEYDITLVSQFSIDRLSFLEILLKHWKGPISLAAYVTDEEALKLQNYLHTTKEVRNRQNLMIHVVYKINMVYPVNFLRNVALNASTTPYVFLNDFDFMPNFDLYSMLQHAVKQFTLDTQKRALVVPAFETVHYKNAHNPPFPKDKKILLEQEHKKWLRPFHILQWEKAHGYTNYRKWLSTDHSYVVKYHLHYEPYVVVHRNVTRYDQRFVGYGWNKVSHIMELNAQGYEFVVLPRAFVIHKYHPVSQQRKKLWMSDKYQLCLHQLEKQFHDDLVQKYQLKNHTH